MNGECGDGRTDRNRTGIDAVKERYPEPLDDGPEYG